MSIIEKRGNMLTKDEIADIDKRCAIYSQNYPNSTPPKITNIDKDGSIYYDNGMISKSLGFKLKNDQSQDSVVNFESLLSGNISDSDIYDDNLSEIVFEFVGNWQSGSFWD